MKHKTHLSILIGTYSFCAMIYWVSGAFYEMFKDIINDK